MKRHKRWDMRRFTRKKARLFLIVPTYSEL